MSREDNGFADWGGYMEAKITKLEEQFEKSSDPFRQSNLFKGISIYVNGLTNPSADELKRIMMVHGGVYHHYQRSHTKFVIASNLPDVKVRNMNTSKVINPQWVVDSLKENKIQDYTKYLLYTNHKPSQPRLKLFQNKEKSLNSNHDSKNESEMDKLDKDTVENGANIAAILQDLNTLKKEISRNINSNSKYIEETNLDVEMENNTDTIPQGKISPNMFEEDGNEIFEKLEFPTCVEEGKAQKCPKKENSFEANKTKSSSTAMTAKDPKFLSEFFNNSRLHHIATLGAGFKQYVSDLRTKGPEGFPAREILRTSLDAPENNRFDGNTMIMHIDMDCFFVSVGLRKRSHLRGKPVAVTHSKGSGIVENRPGVEREKEIELLKKHFAEKFRENVTQHRVDGLKGQESLSEIASCSYEARKKGIHNGMFVGEAVKLCPDLVTIPYDFDAYKEVAFTLYDTIAQYTLDIEAVSCDEMYVDLTDLLRHVQVEPMKFVEFLRNEVKTKTECPCSAGVGRNKLQARMATKKAKPDGQYLLDFDNVQEFFANIPISELPGVGWSTTQILERLSWKTCGDLQGISLSKLQSELGKKFGETIHQFCRGIDNRALVFGQVRKSVSAEVNYGIRFTEYSELEKFLHQLSAEVHSRLIDIKRKGKCITLKWMVRAKEAPIETAKFMGHGVCDHFTRSVSLSNHTDDLNVIRKSILNLMREQNVQVEDLRGIGIQISRLNTPVSDETKGKLGGNIIKTMFSKIAEKKKEFIAAHKEENIENKEKQDHLVIDLCEDNPENLIVKSPTKYQRKFSKGRGRSRVQSKAPVPPKGPDVRDLLRNTPSSSNSIKENPTDIVVNQYDNIDMNVLLELPENIRNEILRERSKILKAGEMNTEKKNTENLTENSATSNIHPFQNPEVKLPTKLVTGKESNICKSTAKEPGTSDTNKFGDSISVDNIFMQPNCSKLIRDWTASTDCPEEYDVNLIASHTKELIRNKMSHSIYVPLKTLCRLTEMKTCDWHRSCKRILDTVQNEMISIYGAKMFLNVTIKCNKCF